MQLIGPLLPGPVRYERHRPETTLLYQLVERHYPEFLAALAQRDTSPTCASTSRTTACATSSGT